MTKKRGRPKKYHIYLESLIDEALYSPAAIVEHALKERVASDLSKDDRRRARHALSRLASNHGFPKSGDGFVLMEGKRPEIGYKGSRWKGTLA